MVDHKYSLLDEDELESEVSTVVAKEEEEEEEVGEKEEEVTL